MYTSETDFAYQTTSNSDLQFILEWSHSAIWGKSPEVHKLFKRSEYAFYETFYFNI